jgi:hypothetical protein
MIDKGLPVNRQVQTGKHEIIERGRIVKLTPAQRRLSKNKQYKIVHSYAEKHQRDRLDAI